MNRGPAKGAAETSRPAGTSPGGGDRLRPQASALTRPLWTAAGAFFLVLGAVGIPLPLLPTTPFLLLAAACFLRGSPRMYGWMMNNRLFGGYLRDYRAGRGIPLGTKVVAIALLWIGIGVSVVVLVRATIVRILLAAVAVVVTAHILAIRTKRSPRRRPSDRTAG